jgi:hypothetical protein
MNVRSHKEFHCAYRFTHHQNRGAQEVLRLYRRPGRRRYGARTRNGLRPPRPQRRREDDPRPDSGHPADTRCRPRHDRRSGRRAPGADRAFDDRLRRAVRRRRRDTHRPGEPRASRPPVRAQTQSGPGAGRRDAPAAVPHSSSRPAGAHLLRRDAPPPRPRRQPRRSPAPADPRRAHDRPRPSHPERPLGLHQGTRARRHLGAADDAVPRGG